MNDEHEEFWEELYQVDPHDAFVNGAYDEYGNQIHCNWCNEELHWNPETRKWYCKNCLKEYDRAQWFDYIDACYIPNPKCISQCNDNYPVCKNWCELYELQDDDPFFN